MARYTAERLMRGMGLRGRPVKTTVNDCKAACPLDKVNRRLQAPRPNALWVSDFTYVATWQGFIYVALVIDTFARRILVYCAVREEAIEVGSNLDKTLFDLTSPAFAERRARARAELDALDPAKGGAPDPDPLRRNWFEAVYSLAENDPARVPWANLAPHPLVKSFVGFQLGGFKGLRLLDVGCGLGDNAECFSQAGADVTAFDLVEEAADWAKRRFAGSKVSYCAADLFAPPRDWRENFDFINECYTLQALAPSLLGDAFEALAALLAPGGKLLLIARARAEDADPASGPPWPLPPSIFVQAADAGLEPLVIEDIAATAEVPGRHWRALLRRSDGA